MYETVSIVKFCKWQLRATNDKDINSFQVVKLLDRHTLSNVQILPDHCQANKNVLGYFLKGILVDIARNILCGKQIQRTLNGHLSVHIS